MRHALAPATATLGDIQDDLLREQTIVVATDLLIAINKGRVHAEAKREADALKRSLVAFLRANGEAV